ncbi:glycosylphosphatidylinositol anchor biosynthesis [Saitoella coloradoensis]
MPTRPPTGDIPWKTSTVFLGLLVLRTLNALTTKTFFQPDEFYQSLEVAHKIAFGYGYITWEWDEGIRNPLHPAIFAALYKVLDIFRIDTPDVVVVAPKVLQGVFAAVGDLYTFGLGRMMFGERVGRWTLFCTVTSSWNCFSYTRTFSNSLETVLTACAMYHWPSSQSTKTGGSAVLALLLAAVACVMRPTNALLWVWLGGHLMLTSPRRVSFMVQAAFLGALAIGVNFVVDSLYYQRPVFTPYNFLQFNLVEGLSGFYGSSPWHYYLTQGLPLLLTAFLPFTVVGLVRYASAEHVGLVGWVVGSYSVIGHKEWRFLYPLLPLLLVYTAVSLSRLSRWTKRQVVPIVFLLNVLVAWYATQVHQRGVIDVMDYLRNEPNVQSVGFLMPCHSTPWQSHLHNPALDAASWFLTCEPPLGLSIDERKTYRDEADRFYDDPAGFLKENLGVVGGVTWPSHLVFFEALEGFVKEYTEGSEYRECARFFNTHIHDDGRRTGDVVVYCRT